MRQRLQNATTKQQQLPDRPKTKTKQNTKMKANLTKNYVDKT